MKKLEEQEAGSKTRSGTDQMAALQAVLRMLSANPPREDIEKAQTKLRHFLTTLRHMLAACEDISAGMGARVAPSAPAPEGPEDGRVRHGLSARESEIVGLLVKGHKIVEIANRLQISESTARNHLKTCYRKLNVHTQIELVHRALAAGIGKA